MMLLPFLLDFIFPLYENLKKGIRKIGRVFILIPENVTVWKNQTGHPKRSQEKRSQLRWHAGKRRCDEQEKNAMEKTHDQSVSVHADAGDQYHIAGTG